MGMTKEEAKAFLTDISYDLGTMGIEYLSEKDGERMRDAIKVLEQEPWKFLNRLKDRMKDRDEDNGGEPLNAVDRGYHLAYEHLCEEIDNLLKENEDGSNNN